MRFEFATATRIVFGQGTVAEVAPAAAELGRRVLLVTGRNAGAATELERELNERGVETARFEVPREPDTDLIKAGVARARALEAEAVIGMGGGSALDTGKTIAVLLTNDGDLFDYLEVVGQGRPLEQPGAPYIGVPTTAGTGSEVTRNAVIASPEHRVKVSLRSPHMLARLAVVDPELTYTLPPRLTASTGLDALTQLIEPFVSNSTNPITDALCREGLARAGRSLQRAYEYGRDAEAREDMALASLMGGLALANARLGAVHGLAGPLGGQFPAPHGALCARLLPVVTETNLRALQARAPESPALERYAELAVLLTGRPEATVEAGVARLWELVVSLDVPPLSSYGMTAADIPAIVPQAQRANSMRGNPIPLTDDEVTAILQQAL